jgi:6-phosphogluconate dehydrogenase
MEMNGKSNDLGLIGLGTMGSNLVLNMADNGFAVAAFNRTTSVTEKFAAELKPNQRVQPCYSIEELLTSLEPPRKIMMMVDAGKPVDAVLGNLDSLLGAGDIVIDGGNSHFRDTERRSAALGARGIDYLGVGISGGQLGARYGPSLMPGGPRAAYDAVRPIFEAIAAQADGRPCVAYLGPGSAGHYVKMVHNGIEYGLMQIIAESYALLRQGLGLDNERLARVYSEWQAVELESYLLQITAEIFRRRDEKTAGYLVDVILAEPGQLGTGMWTSQSAMDLHVPVPNIDIAVSMRHLFALADQRAKARQVESGETGGGAEEAARGVPIGPRAPHLSIDAVRGALFAGMIITYAQGFAQLQQASAAQGYNLALHDVASIWRGGCIIRSALLRDIRTAYEREPHLPNLLLDGALSGQVAERRDALVAAGEAGMEARIPVPGLVTALSYLDGYLVDWLPGNLIQAQRDYFGAHTYRRIDEEGIFHTDWSSQA